MGLIANIGSAVLFFILALAALGIALSLIVSDDNRLRLLSILAIAFFILFAFAWHFSATHRVVPINERWVITNKIKARIDGSVRSSGLTTKPLLGTKIIKFPGAREQPFCIRYTPALKEGYEIFVDVCGNYNAAGLDWVEVYSEYNFTEEEQMLEYWANQSKEVVSLALQEVNYSKITKERPAVSTKIREQLNPWFDQFGVSVSNIKMSNWDFTSEEVKKQVDAASAASMRTTVESQLLEAAKIARERQQYEVETANLILDDRANGLEALFNQLDISSDNAKAELASQMTWFTLAQNPPEGVQIILSVGGGGNLPISIPIDLEETPPPEEQIQPEVIDD